MGQDPLDWEGIKQLFMHSGMSLVRIGATCGVSGCTIGDRAKRDGWVRAVPMVPLPRGRKPRVGPRPTYCEIATAAHAAADDPRRRAHAGIRSRSA